MAQNTGKKNTTAKDSAARRAQVAAAMAEAKRKERRGKLVFRGVLAALLVGGVGGLAAVVIANQSSGSTSISGVQTFTVPPNPKHVTGAVAYPQVPPVGGDHNASPH
jgi:hypothetical protein